MQKENKHLKNENQSLRALIEKHNEKDFDIETIHNKIEIKYKEEIQNYKTLIQETTK